MSAMKTVLLVEDCNDDVFAMKMACKRSGIPHLFQVVTDGEMAMDYLSGEGEYADRSVYPLPDVVFLDINMPGCTGHDVLGWIRQQPGLKKLPVAMLTGSVMAEDVNRAYALGATSYLQKVPEQGEFGQGVRVMLKCWLELNITATRGESRRVYLN